MPDFLNEHSTTREIDAVARLIADCGEAVDMDYCSKEDGDYTCSSGANTKKVIDALEGYGYDENTMEYIKRSTTIHRWKDKLIPELDAERPILYRYKGKHAFVCDGYNYDDPYEFHFNWGWNGANNNGFYDLDHMNPGGHNYSEKRRKHHAIIGIQPEERVGCETEVDICGYTKFGLIQLPNNYFPVLYGGNIYNSCNITIESDENKEYRAYNEIVLNPGFETEDGATFSAEIVPCPTNNCEIYQPIETRSVNLKSYHEKINKDNTTKSLVKDIKKENIQIYPNPNNGVFTLDIQSNNLSESQIILISNTGKQILANNQLSKTMHMDISSYAKGIYFIKLITPEHVITKKIICY